jgi:hypothetical protein
LVKKFKSFFAEITGAGAEAEKIGGTKVRVGVCYFPPASCAGFIYYRIKTLVSIRKSVRHFTVI